MNNFCCADPKTQTADLDLTISLSQFASELYDHVQSSLETPQNIIISPVSIHLAIGLAMVGARGQTAAEMSKGLKLGAGEAMSIANEYRLLVGTLKRRLLIANKIYINKCYSVQDAFKKIATRQFYSEIEQINFAKAENAAKVINQWLQMKTENRVKDMMSSDSLDANTPMVLINAVYFRGRWKSKFDVRETNQQPFFVCETESVQVNMMHQTVDVPYADLRKLDAQVIILKYTTSDVSMVVVLPNKRTGLASLNEKLRKTNLASIVNTIGDIHDEVDISLPRFTAEFDIALPDTLRAMGMNMMFVEEEADFGKLLNEGNRIYCSQVRHKAFIKVDEKGTEAAAATQAQIQFRSISPMPVRFNADHPFRYFIRNEANVVIFDGCYCQPVEN